MSQFDEFNARVERTVSAADREVEQDRRRSAWSRFETSFLADFLMAIGGGLFWAIGLGLGAVLVVAVVFDVSFKVALMILFLVVVAIAMIGMAGSG